MRLLLCIALLYCVIACGNADKSTTPPCCRDTITSCATTMRKDPTAFRKQCDSKADFRLIQCCSTCEAQGPTRPYDVAAPLLANAECFDNETPAACAKYVAGTGPYAASTWRCDGSSAVVAFRICRMSCGYCTKGTNIATVTYDITAALNSCATGK